VTYLIRQTLNNKTKLSEEELISECTIKTSSSIGSTSNAVNTSNTNLSTSFEPCKSKQIKQSTQSLIKSKRVENTQSTKTINNLKRKSIVNKKREKVTKTNKQSKLEAEYTKSNLGATSKTEIRENFKKLKTLDFRLFKMGQKMDSNEINIDRIICKLDTINSSNPIYLINIPNCSTTTIGNSQCNHDKEENPKDTKFTDDKNKSKTDCIDKFKTSLINNPVINKTKNTDTCDWDKCVCKLIGIDKTQNMKPNHDKKNNIDVFDLCKNFTSKSRLSEIKGSESPSKTEQVCDEFAQRLSLNDVKVNSCVTICSKKSNYFLNNKNKNLTQPTFKLNAEKNDICGFLNSQQIPECIKPLKLDDGIAIASDQFQKVTGSRKDVINTNCVNSTSKQNNNINITHGHHQIIKPQGGFSFEDCESNTSSLVRSIHMIHCQCHQTVKLEADTINAYHTSDKIYDIERIVDNNNCEDEIVYNIVLDPNIR